MGTGLSRRREKGVRNHFVFRGCCSREYLQDQEGKTLRSTCVLSAHSSRARPDTAVVPSAEPAISKMTLEHTYNMSKNTHARYTRMVRTYLLAMALGPLPSLPSKFFSPVAESAVHAGAVSQVPAGQQASEQSDFLQTVLPSSSAVDARGGRTRLQDVLCAQRAGSRDWTG